MKKKTLVLIFALLCLIGSFVMYVMADKSVQFTDFKYIFWIPLPISVALLILARKLNDNE